MCEKSVFGKYIFTLRLVISSADPILADYFICFYRSLEYLRIIILIKRPTMLGDQRRDHVTANSSPKHWSIIHGLPGNDELRYSIKMRIRNARISYFLEIVLVNAAHPWTIIRQMPGYGSRCFHGKSRLVSRYTEDESRVTRIFVSKTEIGPLGETETRLNLVWLKERVNFEIE